MIQLAWRFLMFQKDSALARWFRARTDSVLRLRKEMIVALARKLLIALWRFIYDGVVPGGVVLRPAPWKEIAEKYLHLTISGPVCTLLAAGRRWRFEVAGCREVHGFNAVQ
jgi:hypothetical protein